MHYMGGNGGMGGYILQRQCHTHSIVLLCGSQRRGVTVTLWMDRQTSLKGEWNSGCGHSLFLAAFWIYGQGRHEYVSIACITIVAKGVQTMHS